MKKLWFVAGFLVPVLFCVAGCGGNGARGQPMVVCTTGMIGDLVRVVAGDTVEVVELMGPGVDPHLYQPKQSDLSKMERATLIFHNGLHLEGNMAEMLEKHAKGRAVTRDLPKDKLLMDGSHADPHVWFDVSIWALCLDRVAADLSTAFPSHADANKQRADTYRAELTKLHGNVAKRLAEIPQDRRVLVSAHDAFRYFGRAYDVEVVGLQGVSTADEAGLKEVQRVVDRVVQGKIKAIFTETSVSADGIEAVVKRCKERGHEVKIPEGQLFSDALGETGTPSGTYLGMVEHNVRLLVENLR